MNVSHLTDVFLLKRGKQLDLLPEYEQSLACKELLMHHSDTDGFFFHCNQETMR